MICLSGPLKNIYLSCRHQLSPQHGRDSSLLRHGIKFNYCQEGSSEVIIRSTGAHKRDCTVTLTCTASGKMLQPFVTFKAKTQHILKKIKTKECDVIVTAQPKEWMDHQLMLTLIRKVLVKYTKGQHALLVFDTFTGHLIDDVLASLAENNKSYVLIPGSCTSKIQPLDVCLNKPFKTYIHGAWEEYMVCQAQSTCLTDTDSIND